MPRSANIMRIAHHSPRQGRLQKTYLLYTFEHLTEVTMGKSLSIVETMKSIMHKKVLISFEIILHASPSYKYEKPKCQKMMF